MTSVRGTSQLFCIPRIARFPGSVSQDSREEIMIQPLPRTCYNIQIDGQPINSRVSNYTTSQKENISDSTIPLIPSNPTKDRPQPLGKVKMPTLDPETMDEENRPKKVSRRGLNHFFPKNFPKICFSNGLEKFGKIWENLEN
jgi:hypothetical protein